MEGQTRIPPSCADGGILKRVPALGGRGEYLPRHIDGQFQVVVAEATPDDRIMAATMAPHRSIVRIRFHCMTFSHPPIGIASDAASGGTKLLRPRHETAAIR